MASDGWIYTREHPEDRLLPGVGVEISEAAFAEAGGIASPMEDNAQGQGELGDVPLPSKAGQTTPAIRLRAICSQYAAAVACELEPERTSSYERDRPDLGKATEVRSMLAAHPPGGKPMRIYKSEVERHPDRAYVLVYPVDGDRRFWVRGWILAKDAAKYPFRKYAETDREGCYWIPQSCLNNFPVPEVRERSGRRSRG